VQQQEAFEKDGEMKDITAKLDDISLKQLQDLIDHCRYS